ncbi:MAG: DUF2029 domain-containing protein [Mycobacteriaceae bacterium]|nr:DUF2029 domain-containing protein [Mycobacteriaceae bacterium]
MAQGSGKPSVRIARAAPVAVVLTCAVTLLFGYLNKARCVGPPFDESGRSLRFDLIKDSAVCYSDIQYLWVGRDINLHVFPYVHGSLDAQGGLVGGAVEYPVLSGLLMWLGGIGAHTDAEFLRNSALVLAMFALVTAWMLARMRGWAAMWFAASPPLVLYAFHNWELPVVATTVAAMYLVTNENRWSLRTRGVSAGVLLGIGFCLKLYPGVFVLPLALYVLTGGERRTDARDRRGALAVVGAAVATAVLVNLPFAVAGSRGWLASFVFQGQRHADITTNSVWYWGLRRVFARDEAGEHAYSDLVSVASPALVLGSFAVAVWWGWRIMRRDGRYPWIGVSGAMLCAFLLFHKVHSPQYTLWLIPFFVVLAVPWQAVAAYLCADLAIGVGVFRYFYRLATYQQVETAERIVQFGVWGKAALLVFLAFAFVRADRAQPPQRPVSGVESASRAVAAVRVPGPVT